MTFAAAAAAQAAPGPATNDEIALLVLTNQARSNPGAYGVSGAAQPPLVWNDDLAAAARYHSDDMAENGCFGHSSCNGTSWDSRIGRFYRNWRYIGENVIGVASDPRDMHAGWMSSPGHRSNILSGFFSEFGAGIAVGQDAFGPMPYGTEAFGSRGLMALNGLPAIPAGAVLPRTGATSSRELMANFYHYNGGAPVAVRALLGSSCVPLSLAAGSAAHGTYKATRSVSGSGCTPLVFEAIRSDGTRHRFPASGAILVGGASCAERTTTPPTATCSGDPPAAPAPTPTPAPAPAPTPAPPDGSATLEDTKVVLRPGPASKGKGQVSLQTTLQAPADFDPSAGKVRITVALDGGDDYEKVLPQICEAGRCMRSSSRDTVYRARYDVTGVALSFLHTRTGEWRVRFSSRNETLGGLGAGRVQVTVEVGGITATTSLTGSMRNTTLVAE